jgi:hypothetical protein
MNWEAIGAIGEILGAIAVLVTLVYLAAQIRQNSQFVKAATYHSTFRARNEFNFAVAMTPELSALLVRARDDSTSFDAVERQRFNSLMWGLFNLFEDSLIQRANGLLTRETWESTRWAMADMLSSPGVRDWVQRNRLGLTPALQEEIASLVSEAEN